MRIVSVSLLALGLVSSVASAAGRDYEVSRPAPVADLTPAQSKTFHEVYYNCAHEGAFGCLREACAKPARAGSAGRAEIRYLYRQVWEDFPELLGKREEGCFRRAAGRFASPPRAPAAGGAQP